MDWNPVHLHATLEAAFHHKGFSFVRVLQRCPQYTAPVFEEAQQDPSKVLLLTHERGIQIDPSVQSLFPNQFTHDPSNLPEAVDIAGRDDVLPVGLLFHNPQCPRYEAFTTHGLDMTVDEKLEELNRELDRFAI
jgi:2-oxoglutarate ferredoxin oxidoreductase subunit beta